MLTGDLIHPRVRPAESFLLSAGSLVPAIRDDRVSDARLTVFYRGSQLLFCCYQD